MNDASSLNQPEKAVRDRIKEALGSDATITKITTAADGVIAVEIVAPNTLEKTVKRLEEVCPAIAMHVQSAIDVRVGTWSRKFGS